MYSRQGRELDPKNLDSFPEVRKEHKKTRTAKRTWRRKSLTFPTKRARKSVRRTRSTERKQCFVFSYSSLSCLSIRLEYCVRIMGTVGSCILSTQSSTSCLRSTNLLEGPPLTQKGKAWCTGIPELSGSSVSAEAGICSLDGLACAWHGFAWPHR